MINRAFPAGIAVYQGEKLRMQEFHFDVLDRYLDRRDYELVQKDTDSNYVALAADKIEDFGRPELSAELEARKKAGGWPGPSGAAARRVVQARVRVIDDRLVRLG